MEDAVSHNAEEVEVSHNTEEHDSEGRRNADENAWGMAQDIQALGERFSDNLDLKEDADSFRISFVTRISRFCSDRWPTRQTHPVTLEETVEALSHDNLSDRSLQILSDVSSREHHKPDTIIVVSCLVFLSVLHQYNDSKRWASRSLCSVQDSNKRYWADFLRSQRSTYTMPDVALRTWTLGEILVLRNKPFPSALDKAGGLSWTDISSKLMLASPDSDPSATPLSFQTIPPGLVASGSTQKGTQKKKHKNSRVSSVQSLR